jgi:hypothetical protein
MDSFYKHTQVTLLPLAFLIIGVDASSDIHTMLSGPLSQVLSL